MADIEVNNKSRKPTVKKMFSMSDFKKKTGAEDVPYKPFEWIKISPAIQKAIGIPGVAKGYVNIIRGFSNTGKSTYICESIVAAQKSNILPIIFDTENNIGKSHLSTMGFDWDNDFYILVDNEYLLENFGKKRDKNRCNATIEDLGDAMNYYLDLQDSGELPYEILFVVDSIGTLDCNQTVNNMASDKTTNNQWNAHATEKTFKYLLGSRIVNSKKINKEYTNTFLCVNKIWLDNSGIGMPVIKHKNGEFLFSTSRLIIHMGGIVSHGVTRIVATNRGKEIVFGVKVKVSVIKNHLEDLGGIAMNGEIISTPHGFIGSDSESINQYKKEHLSYFRELLGGEISIDDIETKYESSKNDGIGESIGEEE